MMSVLWLVPYGDNQGGGVVERNGSICANNLHKQSPNSTPLVGKDMDVLHHHLLNLVGHTQDLPAILLSIHLNVIDLHAMSVPLLFSVIHLKEIG